MYFPPGFVKEEVEPPSILTDTARQMGDFFIVDSYHCENWRNSYRNFRLYKNAREPYFKEVGYKKLRLNEEHVLFCVYFKA